MTGVGMTSPENISEDINPPDQLLSDIAERLEGDPHVIERVEAVLLRAQIDVPVQTSFGTMRDRPALLVKITEKSGCVGYGEIWCNFPTRGAEYKAGLLTTEFAFWLKGRSFCSPAEIFDDLGLAFAVLALQTADPGTLAQVIAGVDQALWDLVARKRGERLCSLFDVAATSVPAYASGIHPSQAEEKAHRARQQGFTAFKVKVGFGDALDRAGVAAAREMIGDDARLMIDANQAWALPEHAGEAINRLKDFSLSWVEEPLPANTQPGTWQTLTKITDVPLAGGENLPTLDGVADYWRANRFAFLQPDIGKIGGFTGLLRIFGRKAALSSDRVCVYCPHWLGGMVGLAASAHLLAVVGGPGLLEVDVNDNPIRENLADWTPVPSHDGQIDLPKEHGIGISPDLHAMRQLGVHVEIIEG